MKEMLSSIFLFLFLATIAFTSEAADTNDLYTKGKADTGNEVYLRAITENNRVTFIQVYNGFLYAIDAKGHMIWRVKTELYENAFTRFNGFIYTGTRSGDLLALKEDNGMEIWHYRSNGLIKSPPVLYDGILFFGSSDGSIYAIDIETGLMKWSYETERGISSSPVVSEDNILYIGSKDGYLYALDSKDGKLIWKFNAGSAITTNPLIYEGVAAAASADGILYGIDKESGVEKWRVKLENGLAAEDVSSQGVMYTGKNDLYAVDILNGRVLWHFNNKADELYQKEMLRFKVEGEKRLTEDEKRIIRIRDYFHIDSRISSSPKVDGGDISFGTESSYIYLVNSKTGEIKWRLKADSDSGYAAEEILSRGADREGK